MTNKVNLDKLMKYELISEEGDRSVFVPLKHYYRAKKVQNIALESNNMNEFYDKAKLYPSLNNAYIPDVVSKFVKGSKIITEDILEDGDRAFLETCVHLMNDELASMDGELAKGYKYRARERYNAIRNKENIVSALKRLNNMKTSNKIYNGIKYIGKNFWKVLPVGSSINYVKKYKLNKDGKLYDDSCSAEEMFHDAYALVGVFAISGYMGLVSMTNEFSPKKQIKEYIRIEAEKKKIEKENIRIEKEYNKIFKSENPQNFQDSLDMYLKYGLPIKLLNPSFEQRKEAVNKLEKVVVKSIEGDKK